jgi:hypothetical protein
MSGQGGAPLRHEIVVAFDRAWDEIAGPGTWWGGEARVAIAEVARAARAGDRSSSRLLPDAAVEAATVVAATPMASIEAWVARICRAVGEPPYVELVGVVARVMAMDTFHRLTGAPLAPLPGPRPGQPSRESPPAAARRNRTWVAMLTPSPPLVLGAVPAAAAAMNELSDVLYMTGKEMGDPDWRRGDLHRTQAELVATTTSHANQCFY